MDVSQSDQSNRRPILVSIVVIVAMIFHALVLLGSAIGLIFLELIPFYVSVLTVGICIFSLVAYWSMKRWGLYSYIVVVFSQYLYAFSRSLHDAPFWHETLGRVFTEEMQNSFGLLGSSFAYIIVAAVIIVGLIYLRRMKPIQASSDTLFKIVSIATALWILFAVASLLLPQLAIPAPPSF